MKKFIDHHLGRPLAVTLELATVLVLMALAIGGSFLIARNAAARAKTSSVSVQQLCQAGNETRHEQIALWDTLIAHTKPPPGAAPQAIAEQQAQIRFLRAYIHHVFRPRNCATLGHPR